MYCFINQYLVWWKVFEWMITWKLVSVCSSSCKCPTILVRFVYFWFLFLVFCLLTKQEGASPEALTARKEKTERKKEVTYGAVGARQQKQKESYMKKRKFRSILWWSETVLESDLNWKMNSMLDEYNVNEKHWKTVSLMCLQVDAYVCYEWSLGILVTYLGSLTQAAEALVGLAADTAEEDVNWSSHGLEPRK